MQLADQREALRANRQWVVPFEGPVDYVPRGDNLADYVYLNAAGYEQKAPSWNHFSEEEPAQIEKAERLYAQLLSLNHEITTSDDLPTEFRDPLFRKKLLSVIAGTDDIEEAWNAYNILSLIPRDEQLPPHILKIPHEYLHRLVRLFSAARRTRVLFIRLISILQLLHRSGGRVRIWQWNLLLDSAGKNWRGRRVEDFRLALGVYRDMIRGDFPGASIFNDEGEDETLEDALGEMDHGGPRPDIYTLSTLLANAARTREPSVVRHAGELLVRSGLPQSIVTQTVHLGYYTMRNELAGVRATLHKMRQQGLEFDNVAFNATMWAFAYNDRLDIACTMYRIVRHRVAPEEDEEGVTSVINWLYEKETITIPADIFPDETTYHIMIQCLAYRGDLFGCLEVFQDMLGSPAIAGGEHAAFLPTMTVFRAIFLGFFRHGSADGRSELVARRSLSIDSQRPHSWTLENLDLIFARFLELPLEQPPAATVVRWILVAFAKTSDNDARKLREVFDRLDDRFGVQRWSGPLAAMRQKIYRETGGRNNIPPR
ncbi:hypothetical protein BV25DRAFT_1818198 [Artomyces pyxidatus]|uniref:Uncharacterized protein n=1 Tax=Artomyces pyxidatus TaxID=48021 RepID=A0ACB8TLB6_9AGAM|nr:hypothetical protein BV25DRAFT_1818198 [Artomyces pyxidatus]